MQRFTKDDHDFDNDDVVADADVVADDGDNDLSIKIGKFI